MGKFECAECKYVGYATYHHNDYHCSICFSKNITPYVEVKPPQKVLVKSMLGLLGDLENTVCYLIDKDYDINTNTNYAVVSKELKGRTHRIALEHIHEYVDTDIVDTSKAPINETFESKLKVILNEIEELLVSKNKKYGNSALEPVRVFSKASAKEQILVRLDDKLSRLKTQHIDEDEDVLTDLIGYLLLLKMSMKG